MELKQSGIGKGKRDRSGHARESRIKDRRKKRLHGTLVFSLFFFHFLLRV